MLSSLTIWPTGTAQPSTFTLNSSGGQIISNLAIISAGTGTGNPVSIFVTNTSNVILDITGYFVAGGSSSMVYPPGTGVPTVSGGTAWGTTYPLRGTDSKVLTSGTISGTAATLCTDANGGATTSGCPTGRPVMLPV